MKILRNRLLILLCLTSVFFLLVSCQKDKEPEQPIHQNAEGFTDWFETEKEMDQAADLIVKVCRLDDTNNVTQSIEGTEHSFGYTLSQVRIESIYKDITIPGIAVGDTITVLENQFTHKESGWENPITFHVNHYRMMEPDHEYYLYLEYSDQDEWYIPLGATFGKVNEADDEPALFVLEDEEDPEIDYLLDHMNKLRDECLEHWNKK